MEGKGRGGRKKRGNEGRARFVWTGCQLCNAGTVIHNTAQNSSDNLYSLLSSRYSSQLTLRRCQLDRGIWRHRTLLLVIVFAKRSNYCCSFWSKNLFLTCNENVTRRDTRRSPISSTKPTTSSVLWTFCFKSVLYLLTYLPSLKIIRLSSIKTSGTIRQNGAVVAS